MLSHPGFRRLWALGGLNSTMRWLEMIVLGLLAFELTGSPFQVSLAFFFRMIPMLLFGVFIGMLADRFNRKHLLVSGLVAQAVVFGALGWLIAAELLEFWHLLAGTFLVGVVWASEFPVRRTMIGELIGVRLLGRAMGVDSATFNFTRMLGPFMGGGLFEFLGPESTYLLGVVLFLTAAAIAATLDYTPPERTESAERNVFGELAQGFKYIRAREVLVGSLAVTVFVNVWGFPHQAMIPVIGEEAVGAGPVGVGLLSSMQGAGAVIGSLAIAAFASPRHYTRIYLYGSMFFLVTIALFAWSTWYPVSLLFMFLSGFGMTSFGTMQATIMVSASSPEMRGRVMGALSVSIGAQPAGQLHLGTTAEFFGSQIATILMAIEGLVTLAIAAIAWPMMRRGDSLASAEEEAQAERAAQPSGSAAR